MNPKGNLLRIWLLGVTILLPVVVRAQLTFTTNNGAITITGCAGTPTVLNIPGVTNGYPVTSHRLGCIRILHQLDQYHHPQLRWQHFR